MKLCICAPVVGGWSQGIDVSHDHVDWPARVTVPSREHCQAGLALPAKTESTLALLQRDCLAAAEEGELHLLTIGAQVWNVFLSAVTFVCLSCGNPLLGLSVFCRLGFML